MIAERVRARIILVWLITLALLWGSFYGLSTLDGGIGKAFAQATGGPTIQFLNPTQSHSNEISNKSDGIDSLYHIVAWVSTVPSNAAVEFRYEAEGTNREDTICTVSQVTFVSPDTYECKWSVNVADGEGTLIAVLYSNGVSVNRDEEAVKVNNQTQAYDPANCEPGTPPVCPETSDSKTVEITYPSNGGGVGFFRQGTSGPYTGVVEVSSSSDTTSVRVYYSEAAPGTEPAWNDCGTESRANSLDGVRCTLDDGDTPENVRGIAAAAIDAPPPSGNVGETSDPVDSGDGHRAAGYTQDPFAVSLTNGTQSNKAPGSCSDLITATVTDQNGQQIVTANVDAKAMGPTDSLSFDDSGNGTNNDSSPHKAPENHQTESAIDCESTSTPKDFAGSQGDHDAIEADIKHIESTTGTNDAGQFHFKLYSPDPGATQFTVWADEDSNDQLCSAEAQADGSIGWAQAAPGVTGVPDEQTSCPKPGSTPTGSPSTSPSSPPTSPAGTSTTTQGPPARQVTLAADDGRVNFGDSVILQGKVVAQTASCQDDEFVTIQRRILGTTQFSTFATTRTDDQGNFSLPFQPRKNAAYIARVNANSQCGEGSSDPVRVLVNVVVFRAVDEKRAERGETIRFKGAVKPQHDGTFVRLQRRRGDRWVTIARDRLNRRSIGFFRIDVNWRGERKFRVVWPKQDEEHSTGKSRPVTVRAR